MSELENYLREIDRSYKTGIAREHAYRGYLQNLLNLLCPDVLATNEPARIECGSPDYVLTKKNIPLGYIEAKDLDADLKDKKHQEQLDRYRFSLPNFIFTNYLDFHFYREGELTTTISIGKIEDGKVLGKAENYEQFLSLLKSFTAYIGQTIKSPKNLAEMMAKKARLLGIIIENALNSDEQNQQNSSLKEQLEAFKQILIHDIKPKEFSDIYAQTIAYGMFAARLHDSSLNTFSRQEAAELIPKTNPFLRKLFHYIAGYDLDSRIVWIVDDLADIFRATDIATLLENFGKSTKRQDPIIHFYETFLSEYDPALRKSRGVWYTPQPVVNFIVRSVDEILKTEFGLKDGLADTAKIKKKINTHLPDKRVNSGYKQDEKEFHKVQILDPATGTGTFLAEVIKQIHEKFQGQQGIWSSYVDEHLIPRLNGFELLMASYAMAHLKLDLLLSETGHRPQKEIQTRDQRFKIFLTNSLEEHHPDTGTLFANWLSTEANEANHIKRDAPVMVILGNPPYSGESQNKGDWIMDLMESYKKEPNSQEKLKEKNPKWINDDYVKFLRFAQFFIEKNGEGILAFINPHGFLDNPTFRGMRFNLLQAYDKIYTIDLHGNAKKKETTLDGSKDENVFDIQQGVSINIFVKSGKKKSDQLAQVLHFDCYGKREDKYNFLWENSLSSIAFKTLPNVAPMYFMVPKDFDLSESYEKGFSISDIFPLNSVGIVTAKDAILINDSKDELLKNVSDFFKTEVDEKFVQKISYRPFDNKFVYYDLKIIERAREKVMQHFLVDKNLGFVTSRINRQASLGYFFISKIITDLHILDNARDSTSFFPLYLYESQNRSNEFLNQKKPTRTPNLNPEIIKEISTKLGLEFIADHETFTLTPQGRRSLSEKVNATSPSPLRGEGWGEGDKFSPLDLLDYIYAALHSPNYRKKYKEFLKIDFPRVPYPQDQNSFWQLVKLGSELRKIHLLESEATEKLITAYPQDGTNRVDKIKFEQEKVWINEKQYFDSVPVIAWEFYIGGYQPAQKWLKDRKGKILNIEDILHYQKIILALSETSRLMKQIDQVFKF
jgi:predicted helicase